MSFNISALNTFRNVNLGGDNAIANLNGEGGISYLDENKTFYIIDTTKIPKNEKAWDMENTIFNPEYKA